jgi:serine protease
MKNKPPRRHPIAAASLGALLACTLPGPAGAGQALPAAASAADPASALRRAAPATDRLIVKYRGTATAASAQQDGTRLNAASLSAARAGAAVTRLRITAQGAHVLRLDRRLPEQDVARIAADLAAADPDVEYAEPDRIVRPMLVPNDARFSQQWHYSEATAGINAPAAWDKATGTGIVVAVIDTGVRPHADLAANLVQGFDFISDTDTANDGSGRDSDPSDPGDFTAAGECAAGEPAFASTWHGTHVSGTIAAVTNNGSGVAGVAFNAKVQMLRALGKCGGFTSDIADAIRWAAGGTVSGVAANATPARVINMSLGGGGACDSTSQAAINDAVSRGAVVVVAAGNETQDAANVFPANCSNVVAVAAVGRTGARASYSNFGTVVDLAAPGGDGSDGVLSTINAGSTTPTTDAFAEYLGTSMATPHVAAVAALMLSVNSALTPAEVETRLKASVRAFPANCTQCGAGLVDAGAAVDAALVDAGAAPAPSPTPAPAASDDDGGGALGAGGLGALLAAALAAGTLRRRPRRG